MTQRAQAADPRIRDRTLEHWRNQRLLPSLNRVGQDGLRPKWVYPPGAEDQLDALLRLRESTRDPNLLRAALWYEGYDVPTSAARVSSIAALESLLHQFELEVAKAAEEGDSDPRRSALQRVAKTLAGKRKRALPRIGRQSAANRIQAAETLLGLALGETTIEERGESDAESVERLMGADRGRRFRPNGVSPWNGGPALENLAEFAKHARISHLTELLRQSTEEDLEKARALGRALVQGVSLFARMTDATLGRENASGMLAMTFAADDPFVGALMPALVLSLTIEEAGADRMTQVLHALSGAVEPTQEAISDFLAQTGDERERREALIDALPFAQRLSARRLLAEFTSNQPTTDQRTAE